MLELVSDVYARICVRERNTATEKEREKELEREREMQNAECTACFGYLLAVQVGPATNELYLPLRISYEPIYVYKPL